MDPSREPLAMMESDFSKLMAVIGAECPLRVVTLFPEARSQITTDEFSRPIATSFPLLETATEATADAPPLSTRTQFPVLMSHIRADVSLGGDVEKGRRERV